MKTFLPKQRKETMYYATSSEPYSRQMRQARQASRNEEEENRKLFLLNKLFLLDKGDVFSSITKNFEEARSRYLSIQKKETEILVNIGLLPSLHEQLQFQDQYHSARSNFRTILRKIERKIDALEYLMVMNSEDGSTNPETVDSKASIPDETS